MVLILDSSLEESAVDEELSKITAIIEKSKGKVKNTDIWGTRKLSYPIKHQENGFYVLLHFDASKDVLTEIDRINKINDKVLRHFIVKASGNQ